MAAQSYVDYLNMFAKANVPVKKHTKGIQLLALKYKLLHKTFGPFMDLWLKMQQGVQTFGEALEVLAKPVEESAEGIEKLNEATGGTVLNFRSLILSITIIIGIIMAFIGIVALMAGSFANMDSVVPGTTGLFDTLKNTFSKVASAVMGVVTTIMSLDFSPILEPMGILIVGIVALMGIVLQLYAVVSVGWMEMFALLGEGGQLQAIIDAVAGVFESVIWGFGFIIAQLDAVGITGGTVVSAFQTFVDGFVAFLFDSGIIDFVVEVFSAIAETAGFIIKIAAVIIGILIRFVVYYWKLTKGYWTAVAAYIGILVTLVVGIVRVILALWRGLVALFSGDFKGAAKHFGSIIGIVTKTFDKVRSLFSTMIDGVMYYLDPLIDMLQPVIDFVANGVSAVGDFFGGFGFSDGGVASGPSSGYPATLHGTEAIVPLPNGRSIPVDIKGAVGGGGGGDNITVNINVSGGGNAEDIAKKVSQEVARTFRNRSRSSGFGRGI